MEVSPRHPPPWHSLVAALGLLCAFGAKAAVPLPPPRPVEQPSPVVPLPVPRPEEAGPFKPAEMREPFGPPAPRPSAHLARDDAPFAAGAEDLDCTRILASGKLVADRQANLVGEGGCGIAAPVTLKAVVLVDGHRVAIEPPTLMRCALAEGLADWLREDIAAADPAHGRLVSVAATGYACRGLNNMTGAPLSEHAHGNAVDIMSFRFEHRSLGLKDTGGADVLATINHTACARFNTMLGPGSDGYHEDHLHLDLKNRKSTSHYCHWN